MLYDFHHNIRGYVMSLALGSLQTLVLNCTDRRGRKLYALDDYLAERMLRQMLQALDFVAWNGFIHKNVKPENILFNIHPGEGCRFVLGDFGLCQPDEFATMLWGTNYHVPPETHLQGLPGMESQTSKIDIWSLFVSLLWARDTGFIRASFNHQNTEQKYRTVKAYVAARPRVESDIIYKVRAMSIWNPVLRPSAAQMILEYFNGEGLSTPQEQVQPYDGASIYGQWVSLPEDWSFYNEFPAVIMDQVELLSAELEKFHIS